MMKDKDQDRDRFGGDDMGGGRMEGGSEKRGFFRKRGCRFCADHEILIDHKDRYLLKPFVTERYKIVPRRISGNCAKHQRELTVSIKRARHLAILPYTSAQIWSKNV